MSVNLVRALAVSIVFLLCGGAMAAGTIERREVAATGVGIGGDYPSEEETVRNIIQTCVEFVAGEVDLMTDFGVQATTVKRGDPFWPIVNETYRLIPGDRFRFGHQKALDNAVDRIETWCAANAVGN